MEDLQKLINEKQAEILEMKAFLNSTDYISLKKVEGYVVDEDVILQRRAARDRINKLELEIKELEVQLINKLELEIKELEVQLNNLTNNEEINHEDNG